MRPIKRLEANSNAIMWAEDKKVRKVQSPMKLNQHSYNFLDNKNKVKKILTNINNANSYINQMKIVHQQLVSSNNFGDQLHQNNFERR